MISSLKESTVTWRFIMNSKMKAAEFKSIKYFCRYNVGLYASKVFLISLISLSRTYERHSSHEQWNVRILQKVTLFRNWKTPQRPRDFLTPFWHYRYGFFQIESKKMSNIRPKTQFAKNLSGVNVFNELRQLLSSVFCSFCSFSFVHNFATYDSIVDLCGHDFIVWNSH